MDVFSEEEMIVLTGGKKGLTLFGLNIIACGDNSPVNGHCPVTVNNNVPQCVCS